MSDTTDDMEAGAQQYEDYLSRQTNKRRQNMSNTTQEVLTVEAITQYGVKANGGKNYSISTRLANSGIKPQNFVQGAQYQVEVWTGPQGGKKINSFQPMQNGGYAPAPVAAAPVAAFAPPPMPPALPVTTVAATQAPGGIAPVQKTNGHVNGHVNGTEEKMSKADWAVRNSEIAIQAIVKSSIESPSLGEHVTGKSTPEFFALQRAYIKENLETYRMAVQGLL